MASSWIKIEVITPDKPEIYQLAEILSLDPDAVLGKLIRIWVWADQQTIDGNANSNAVSVTKSAIDRIAFHRGFSDSLLQVGWLRYEGSVLIFPNFERHNGESSKKRALTNKRVTEHRQKKLGGNAIGVTREYQKALPEEEEEVDKELKDKNTMSDSTRTGESELDMPEVQPSQDEQVSTSDLDVDKTDPVDTVFEEIFWIAGLRKDAKVKSRSAFRTKYREWKKLKHGTPEEFALILAADIRERVQANELGVDKLLPTSYLNGERWNDERIAPKATVTASQSAPQGSTWCTPATDGSAEVFINTAALSRAHNGGYR